jgi:hypothetical protein
MRSQWDLGKRPAKPKDERAFKAVSTYISAAKMRQVALLYDLGEFIAELEVPDEVERTEKPDTGHVDLHETTPEQLLGYVRGVRSVDEVASEVQ